MIYSIGYQTGDYRRSIKWYDYRKTILPYLLTIVWIKLKCERFTSAHSVLCHTVCIADWRQLIYLGLFPWVRPSLARNFLKAASVLNAADRLS